MKKKIHDGFTLAEVLITLGIIGIVAALSLPTLIANNQQKVLKTQFLKAYNVLTQALTQTVNEFGAVPQCYVWLAGQNPYPPQICTKWNESGRCIKWGMADGGPYPKDWTGPNSDCTEFYNTFYKNLKIIKKCKNTEQDGCTLHYKGQDTIMKNNDDSLTDQDLLDRTAGDPTLREERFNKLDSVVLVDGITIIEPYSANPFIDINGKKGPNKWGYDLYRIRRTGTPKQGIYFQTQGHPIEAGGKSWQAMLESCYK